MAQFSRWFRYRTSLVPPQLNYIIWIRSLIGSFGRFAIGQIMFTRSSYFVDMGVPPLIASEPPQYSFTAFLDAPLSQPRALIGGHFPYTILGTVISKLVLLPPDRCTSLQFLASLLSTANAIVLVQMTGTSHPSAGALALIQILDDRVRGCAVDEHDRGRVAMGQIL
ncbi:hypothetical protein BKA70DRAFT_1518449 [Coprinopsis sp. MPI-PUGE-AT-0042]|nr:hypothetical protein BKA70DRAFT_1518449 [Coprinopsis sp. MPI-PUGE-AT-0042]